MKKHLTKRLLSLALALVMLLGMIPTGLGITAEASDFRDQQDYAAELKARIEGIKGTLVSKYQYVKLYEGFDSNDATKVKNANDDFKGLNGGTYMFVTQIGEQKYVMDPTASTGQGFLTLSEVTVDANGGLLGVDPSQTFTIERDMSTEAEKEVVFPKSGGSARYHAYLKTKDGRYLSVSNTVLDSGRNATGIKLWETKSFDATSITLFVSYADNVYYIFQSGAYPTSGTRYVVTNLSSGTPYVKIAEDATSGTTTNRSIFRLYKEDASRVHVEPLYNAIMEAEPYLDPNNCNPYGEEYYFDFLLAVENALGQYDMINGASYDDLDDVPVWQGYADEEAKSLRDATTRVKPYDLQIRELEIPVTQKVTGAPNGAAFDGTYFVSGWDDSGFHFVMDGRTLVQKSSDITVNNNKITLNGYSTEDVFVKVQNGRLYTDDLTNAIVLNHMGGSNYSFRLSNGEYLNMVNNYTNYNSSGGHRNIKHNTPQAIEIAYNLISKNEDAYNVLVREANNQMLIIRYPSFNFDAWHRINFSKTDYRDFDIYLFKVSPLTLKLYQALKYMEPYAGGNDGRYDEATYNAFAAELGQALDNYYTYCNTMENSSVQAELDRDAEALKAYGAKLTLADTQSSYIDIPVEILDFTSDRLMFEWYQGGAGQIFHLADISSVETMVESDARLKALVEKMKEKTVLETSSTNSLRCRTGLVKSELVNGLPVYEEHTVGYIAAAILSEWMADEKHTYRQTHATEVNTYENSFNSYKIQWQDTFWNLLVDLYADYHEGDDAQKENTLGTYAKTLDKIAKNNGVLPWAQVTTAFDLAYYVLNGIWTPTTEILPNGKTYNTVVTERDTLRLYRDEATGLYTINSANRMAYDGYMIYNTQPQISQDQSRFPRMTPIDGLGFEAGGVETDPGSHRAGEEGWNEAYANTNMHFTLHASGSFIYYEDQDQKFEFSGDDDVYFFVNNKLVMDIGGSHSAVGSSLDLRKANEEMKLGLEDGGVYSFDMFYAERHTNGSNMKFSTNIKIVSAETMTSKGQYAVEVAGSSTVGSNGKGGEMIDNQLVNVGDVVAYSFDIDNYREVPVVNLEFYDPTLGVNMNKDSVSTYDVTLASGNTSISVTDPNKTNGVATLFTDLIIEYIPYDSTGNLATGTIREIDPEEMIALIRSKASVVGTYYQYAPLDPGTYRVRVRSAAMLKKILAEGIPMACKFSIYGFCRKTVSSDDPYENELTTYCSYRRSPYEKAELATITGKASRYLRVPAASEMPDIPRIEITLDYGKPVQIPLADITNQIFFEKDSPASVGEIVGYVEEGYNGQLLKKLPNNRLTLSTGDTVDGLQGTFTLRETSMEYAMWEFMEKVETLYAVVKLNNFNHAASGTQYEYALVELRLIPANMMYYEAEDFATSEISYEQVGGSYSDWEIKTDGIGIDRDNIPEEAFFVDFDGQGYGERYRDRPQYHDDKGNAIDFDKTDAWFQHTNRLTTVDTTAGVLQIEMTSNIAEGKDYYHYAQTITTRSAGSQGNTKPLNLIPGEGHIFQMRLRVENCVPSEGNETRIFLMMSDNKKDNVIAIDAADAKETDYLTVSMDPEQVFSGEYFTVTGSLDGTDYYTQSELIDAIRFQIEGVKDNGNGGKIQIDYIYVGPEQGKDQDFNPVNHRTYDLVVDRDSVPAEAFFVDFDGQGYGERYRDQPQYKGNDFDKVANWATSGSANSLSVDPVRGILTGLSGKSGTTLGVRAKGLAYPYANEDNYAMVRLRLEDMTLAKTATLSVTYDNSSADFGKKVDLTANEVEKLNSGEYITVSIHVGPINDTSVSTIYAIFNHGGNVTYGTSPKIIFDYIYVGPEQGMKQEIYGDYLYFGFTNTASDQLRYSGGIYGTTVRNYDLKTNWSSDTAGSGANSTINITDGCLVFSDKAPNTEYNFVEASPTVKADPMKYKLTGNDVFRIRFKVTGDRSLFQDGKTQGLALQYAKEGRPAAYVTLNSELLDGEFHTLTMPMDTTQLKDDMAAGMTELNRIRINFSQIKDGVFTIDYIYVGPAELVESVTEKADYLFFDFTNNSAATTRYSNAAYGTLALNFDSGNWHYHSTASTKPQFDPTAGTMSFSTTTATPADRHMHTVITTSNTSYTGGHPLTYTPAEGTYVKVRMKIDGPADMDKNIDFRIRFAHANASDSDSNSIAFSRGIPAEAINNGFFVLEGYADFQGYDNITAIRPEVYNLLISDPTNAKNAVTFTYDYIYVGPMEKTNIAADSLYFGFDNDPEDQERYANHTYGGYNFDHVYLPETGRGIGSWVTSEVVNGTHLDYTVDNTKGTLNLGVTGGYTENESGSKMYGPYLLTTETYNQYGMEADRAVLNYRPENADVVQFRFRVSNCQIVSGAKPRVVFLFGGYNDAGVFTEYRDMPTMLKYYTMQDGYITVSIPTHQAFRDLNTVTNLGLRFQNIYSDDGTGLIEIDYIYVGPGEGAPYTYGYDSSYDTNSLYSDGESLFTEGNGVRTDAKPNPDKYTETRFSFTGTGFDLISRTGADQGQIRVEIYTDPSYDKDYRLEGASVNMKGELELYQIPVYSKHNLTYGTYYVSVMVNAGVNYPAIPVLSRGDDFYLDAIRIYDPIDVSKNVNAVAGSDSAIAYTAYLADIEAHPDIQEVRNILVTAEEFNAGGKIMDGAVFVDYSTIPEVINPTTGEDVTDPDMDQNMGTGNNPAHLTASVQTYKKVGPNNETYLGPQQLVAFRLLVYANKVPGRLDIGAKSIRGETTNLLVKIWDTGSNLGQAYKTKIQGPSHQYYSLYLESDVFKKITDENGKSCYMTTILITNPTAKTTDNEANILSITDIRAAFKDTATRTDTAGKRAVTASDEIELPEDTFEIRYVVMGDLKEAVDEALKDTFGICEGEHIPGTWQTVCLPGVGRDGIEQLRCTRCGEVLEEKRTPGITAMTFAGASVSLQSDLAIHYKVNESYLTELGYTNPYVVVTDNGVETVIRDYTVNGGKLSFVYKNIAPHRMGDTVTATLYASYGGTVYAFESRDYSVADYCYNMLSRYGENPNYGKLRTLLVDILLYGAESQKYTKYHTDRMCTDRLTEEQLSWGTELTRELVNLRDQNYEVIDNPTVQWKGAGLNLQESVAVRFKIRAEDYEGLEVRITLAGVTVTVTPEDFDYTADGVYVHFTKLNAAQMSEPIYVAVYRDGLQVSNTVRYSIESYAYAKQDDTTVPYLADLVKRMICYGDSARAYVGK